MKAFLSSLFLLIFSHSQAQLLDPLSQWFSLRDYFDEEVIKERAITAIEIEVSEKADGRIIDEAGEKLKYDFNASGYLIRAQKRIPLYRGFDTAWVSFNYDLKGRMIQSKEHHGPYDFEYLYLFTSDSSFNSIKLRPKSTTADTLFYRKHLIRRTGQDEEEAISNRNGITFMEKKRQYDEYFNLIEETLEYVFSRKSSQMTIEYENGQLINKAYKMDYGQRSNSRWEYIYKSDFLDEVKYYEKQALKKRLVINYRDNLPSAVIVRNIDEEALKIYLFKYTFY